MTTQNLNLATLSANQGAKITYSDYYGGNIVSDLGDVNGDGYGDFIIYTSTTSGSGGTMCFIVYGNNNLPLNFNFNTAGELGVYTVISGGSGIGLGPVVSGAGDVNGDGLNDIIIASRPNVFLVYGSTTLPSQTKITLSTYGQSGVYTYITETSPPATFGSAVSSAGDINNDGCDDIIIGANQANNYNGYAVVILGNNTLSSFPVLNIANINKFTIYGYSGEGVGNIVNSAGDVNNDGFDDIIISGYYAGYLLYGKALLPSSITLSSSGENGVFTFIYPTDHNTPKVSGAGDVNNDGFDDFMFSSTGTSNGMIYVYYGSSALPNQNTLASPTITEGFSITGVISGSGNFISAAGDVNKDNFDDIIIGNHLMPGTSYVVYGNFSIPYTVSLNNFYGFSINNTAGYYNNFENSVSGGGDINGDGYSDVLIAVEGYSGSPDGYTYVVYGAASGFATSFPTSTPTSHPSSWPSGQPSGQPTSQPTSWPSGHPTGEPTGQPTSWPSGQPSGQPTSYPSSWPSGQPSGQPTSEPTIKNHHQESLSIGAIAGIAIAGIAILGGGYGLYAHTNKLWPFIVDAVDKGVELAGNTVTTVNPITGGDVA